MNIDFDFLIDKKISMIEYNYIEKSVEIYVANGDEDEMVVKFWGCVGVLDHGVIGRKLLKIWYKSSVGIMFFELIRLNGLDPSIYKEIIFNTGTILSTDKNVWLNIAFESYVIL